MMMSLAAGKRVGELNESTDTEPLASPRRIAFLPSAFLHACMPVKDPGPDVDWVRGT